MQILWGFVFGGGLGMIRIAPCSNFCLFARVAMQLKVRSTGASFHSLNVILNTYLQRILPNLSLTFLVVFSAIILDGIKR